MKAYTQFVVSNHPKTAHMKNPHHLTHKYFGEVTEEELIRIERIIRLHFFGQFKRFRAFFPKVDFFGPKKDIRVLLPDPRHLYLFELSLREKLDAIKVTPDFPDFAPHVATILPPTVFEFDRYQLVVDGKVVLQYVDWNEPAEKVVQIFPSQLKELQT